MSNAKHGRRAVPGNGDKLVRAAIGCIEKFGAAKTTMEDIAAGAGVGRQTVYRAFATRGALFDAVALRRLQGMQKAMLRRLDACVSLEDAVVRGTLAIRRIARKDLIFMEVVEAVSDRGLERYLLAPAPPIRRVMVDLWSGTLARARARGQLRADLADADIADWLRFVNFMLFLRADLSPAQQRLLLRRFVLPALERAAGTR